jgi:lysozyme family protein
MFISGEGDLVVAYRENIWLLNRRRDSEENVPVMEDIEQTFGLSPEDDVHDLLSTLEEKRPDVLRGEIDGDRLILSGATDWRFGRGSHLLKKVMQELQLSGVTYLNSGGDPYENIGDFQITGKVPEALYHGTTSENALGILRFGLAPDRAATNYPGRFKHPPIYHEDKVFLSENIDKAEHHAFNAVTRDMQYGSPGYGSAKPRGFPVIFRFRIPDPNLLVPDLDVEHISDKPTGTYDYVPPRDQYSPKIQDDPTQFSRQTGIFGYKGRIPANFISDIYVWISGDIESEGFDESNWESVTAEQLERALDWGDPQGVYHEPEEDEDYCPECNSYQDENGLCDCDQEPEAEPMPKAAMTKTAAKRPKAKTNDLAETKTENYMIHDIDRYISDDIAINVTFQETANRYSVGVYSVNYKVGVSGYQEYWHYDRKDRKKALRSYNAVCAIVADLVEEIEFNQIPHTLAKPFLRKRLDKVDIEHKERSGVYHYNWYVGDVEKAEDWRTTIYGKRYPQAPYLERMDHNWNDPGQSSQITTTGTDRHKRYQFRYAETEKDAKRGLGFLLGLSPALVGAFLIWATHIKNVPEDQIIEQAQTNPQALAPMVQEFQEHAEIQQYEAPQSTSSPVTQPSEETPFDTALATTLSHEGGYVKNKLEESYRGVRKVTYEKYLRNKGLSTDSIDMHNIPQEHVVDIYRSMYWEPSGAGQLPTILGQQVFDFAVNSGTDRAVKYLQRLIGVKADGEFGPKTKAAVDRAISKQGEKALAKAYVDARRNFVQTNVPKKFRKGVLNRVDSMAKLIDSAKDMPIKPNSPEFRSKDVPERWIRPFWSNQIQVLHDKEDEPKDMAFPVTIPYIDPKTDTGAYRVDERMSEETAEAERERHGDPQWLGSGQFGAAIECKPGFACKYTDDPGEAAAAEKAQQATGGVVKVHEVKQIQNEPPLWAIITDKIRTLDSFEQDEYLVVRKALFRFPEEQKERFQRYDQAANPQKLKELDNAATKMIHQLTSQGFTIEDINPSNVGWDSEGNIVLFDLGLSVIGRDSDYYRRTSDEVLDIKANLPWKQIGRQRQMGTIPMPEETRTAPVTAQTKPMALEPGAYQTDPTPHRLMTHLPSVPSPWGGMRILQPQDPKELEELYAGVHASTSSNIAAIYANNRGTKNDPPVVIEFATTQQWEPDVDAMNHYIDYIHEKILEIPELRETVEEFEKNNTVDWEYINDVFEEIESDTEWPDFDRESSDDINEHLQENAQRGTLADLAEFFKMFYAEEGDPKQQTFDFHVPRYLVGFYEWYLVPLVTGQGTMDARIDAWFMNQMRFMEPITEDEILAIYEVTRYNSELYEPWNPDTGEEDYRETDDEGRQLISLQDIDYWEPTLSTIWESPNADAIRKKSIPIYYHGTSFSRAQKALSGILDVRSAASELVTKHGWHWGKIATELRDRGLSRLAISSVNEEFLKKIRDF